MNKNILITIIVLSLVAGVMYFFVNDNSTSQNSTLPEGDSNIEESNTDELMEEPQNDAMAISTFEYMPVEDATQFVTSEGTTVSYVAQKRFLTRPHEAIVATTGNVNGKGWVSAENGIGQIEIMINVDDLVSESEKRDEDIMALFESTDVKLTSNLEGLAVMRDGSEFTITVPAELTVNNITEVVELTVTGTMTNDMLNATGTTSILLSAYNLNPPSLANVYTVDDEIELRFVLVGTPQ